MSSRSRDSKVVIGETAVAKKKNNPTYLLIVHPRNSVLVCEHRPASDNFLEAQLL